MLEPQTTRPPGALREVGEQREVEHDRLADEKAGRTRQRGVDLGKPFHDRHDGAEYERDIGATTQPDHLTRWISSDVHDVSTRLSY